MWSFVLMGFIAFPTLQDRDVDDGYSFFIDGEPRNLRPWSLNGNPVVRATGDVVFVGEIPIVLGEPGIWRFRTTPEEDGRLFRVDDNGKETVIGVSIGWNMKDGKKIIFDPISRLSDDEIRGLQGLRLDSWPPGLEKKLALMNPARMGVVVTDRVEQDGALPALPEGLRYLWVSESSSAGIKDFTTLASQRELRILGLDLVAAKAFDVSLLKGNTSLRVLSLGMKKLLNIESLAVLTELRIADLQWNEEVRTIEWVRGMKSLKAIYLHGTGVGDLSPLEGLSSLATVRANQAPVRQLPRGSLPALREMSILSTKISDAEADAFRRANPGCKVAHRWMSTLQEALASATRLRVRSGGTCHRRVSEEKTLIEIKDPKEVQAFVKSLVVDETQSDRHCMCCGDPSFEFYEGDKLVATLGFHHGSGLRWPGGWPADAAPTAECANLLVDWLAQRGVQGPKDQRDEGKRQQAALDKRWRRVREILPPITWDLLVAARSRADAEKALESAADSALGRAKLFLRLYGSHDGSWNLEAGFDSIIKARLEKLDGALLSEATTGLLEDAEGAMGAARWILNEKRGNRLSPEARAQCFPVLARIGLCHSRAISRERTLQALVALKDPAAIEPLKEVVSGKLIPRKVKAGDEDEPNGMVSAIPGDREVPDGVSDVAYAAYALATLGDRSMTEQIRALRGKAAEKDAELLDKALRLLEKKD